MKKYEQKTLIIKAETHRAIQLCAKYFSCTQSGFIELLLKFAFLTDTDELKQSSVRLFKEHLDYFIEHGERKPGLKEFLNQIEEKN